MTFTVQDYHDMVRLLRDHPELQVELRQLLLSGDLLALPDIVRELAEAQRRTQEAQQRTEEQLAQLATQVNSLAEAQRRTEEQLAQLTARVDALAEQLVQLTARVDALAEAQQRTEEQLTQLAEAQRRTEERVGTLAEAQQRMGEQLAQLAADVRALTGEVRRLADWQRGEAGRREGEQYERRIARRGFTLFNGGEGGAPDDPPVYQHMSEIMNRVPDLAYLTEEQDPMLADLIWWKDGQYVVVEVSLVVDEWDVIRAARRAQTLRTANVQAMGMVIGWAWSDEETRRRAGAEGVQWRVGDDLSEGYLAFCRRPG